MLIITRREFESFTIDLEPQANPFLSAAALFRNGPMMVKIRRHHGSNIKLGIDAPRELVILRSELRDRMLRDQAHSPLILPHSRR